jgi:hypothetical protein
MPSGEHAPITDIHDLNVDLLTLGKPSKADNSLFAKIRKLDRSRVYVNIPNATVVKRMVIDDASVPRYIALDVHVRSSINRVMTVLDEYLISQVTSNKSRWFSKGLDSSVIDEFYRRSVVTNSSAGTVLRIRLASPSEGGTGVQDGHGILGDSGRYDLVLQLRGLRFFKQCFMPEWELTFSKRVETTFLNAVLDDVEMMDDDDEVHQPIDDDQYASCDAAAPTIEDLEVIIGDIRLRSRTLQDRMMKCHDHISEILRRLESIDDRLSSMETSRVSVVDLDGIEMELDGISMKADDFISQLP